MSAFDRNPETDPRPPHLDPKKHWSWRTRLRQQYRYCGRDGLPTFSYRELHYKQIYRYGRVLKDGYSTDEQPTAPYKERHYKKAYRNGVRLNYGEPPPEAESVQSHRTKIFWFLVLPLIITFIGALWFSAFPISMEYGYDALPNYALQSEGAVIHKIHCSSTYTTGFFEPLKNWVYWPQMRVIQATPPLVPGQCWRFPGSQGHLHVELAQPVLIKYVSVGHSPDGDATSAPKSFAVYGMKTLGGEGTLLGRFQYRENGPELQTFRIGARTEAYRHVRIEVDSNRGNADYTCLYSFGVHGRQQEGAGVAPPAA